MARPLLVELGRVDGWLDENGVADATPFLIGPGGEYDVALNDYFVAMRMAAASPHTREAAARDLARFFDFLWFHRPPLSDGMGGERRRLWRDATKANRRAFEWWRCRDESGPQVRASTWDREVASANGFYRWAVGRGHMSSSPVVQRPLRDGRRGVARRSAEAEVPAEYRPDERRDQVAWLTPSAYRFWRDVGVRGYGTDGLPDLRFRGRNISRNAAFCDLMVRCGLRLQEQTSLTVYEVPDRAAAARFHRS